MKIDLPVGTRGKLVECNKSYTRKFLKKYGVKFYTKPSVLNSIVLNSIVLAETVQTKHGEIVVHDDDVLTYVGGKKWAVEQRKEQKDGIAQG